MSCAFDGASILMFGRQGASDELLREMQSLCEADWFASQHLIDENVWVCR